jgi:DNA primase
MPGISKETIEHIRSSANIVEIIGSYIPLKRAGKEYRALSPFNKEKTPSFYVDPTKGLFKCFSSGHGGDIFKFIMLYENVDFPGAVRLLAQRLNIPIEEDTSAPELEKENHLRDALLRLHNDVAAWWSHILHHAPEAQPARDYLQSRHIPLTLAREFSLGYALPAWDSLLQWARKKGYPAPLLRASGLFIENESTNHLYDRFRDRLIFPIFSDSGQTIAFSGRILTAQENVAKYINSPDTPIFRKGHTLYGLHKAKRPILDAQQAILCEGPTDLIRCHQHGFRNTIATQGTAFTEEQARLLRRYTQEILLCYDSDRAGENATTRSLFILLAHDIDVRIITMPKGQDPDTYLTTHPPEAFQHLITQAPHYIDHYTEKILQTYPIETPKGRAKATEALTEILRHVPDPIKRETYALTIATRLQIPKDILLDRLHTTLQQSRKSTPTLPSISSEPSSQKQQPQEAPLDPVIEHLLAFLIAHPEYVPHVARHLPATTTRHLHGGHLVPILLDLHAQDLWETPDSLIQAIPDETEKNTLTRLTLCPPNIPTQDHIPYLNDLLTSLQRQSTLRRITLLEQEIKTHLLSPQILAIKTKELLDLRRALANL